MTTVLKTERTHIRHLTPADFDDLFAVCTDAELMQMMGDGEVLSAEQVRKWIEVSQNNYQTKGYGNFAVIENASQAFMGFAGLVYSSDTEGIEIIYCLKQAYWGKGYATEVCAALLQKGLTDFAIPQIYATIHFQNAASVRVVEKSGMQYEKTLPDPDNPEVQVLYYVIRP